MLRSLQYSPRVIQTTLLFRTRSAGPVGADCYPVLRGRPRLEAATFVGGTDGWAAPGDAATRIRPDRAAGRLRRLRDVRAFVGQSDGRPGDSPAVLVLDNAGQTRERALTEH